MTASPTAHPLSFLQMRTVDRIGRQFLFVVVGAMAAGLLVGFDRSLLALTFVGIGAAVYGLKNPVVGLLGVGILCTLDPLSRVYIMTGGLLRWNTFNYLLLLVILANLTLLLKFSSLQFYYLIALVGVLGVGLLYSELLEDGIQHLLGAVSCVGLLVYFLRVRNIPSAWVWLGIVCGVLAALGGLLFYLQRDSLPPINKNSWAFFPLTAVFTVCLVFRTARGDSKLESRLLILALINGIWLFLSSSRGATLIGIVCLLYLFKEMRNLSQRAFIIILGVGFCLMLTSLFSDLNQRSVYRATELIDSSRSLADRTSGRTDLVRGGWYIFLESPVFGSGTGSFPIEYAKVSEEHQIGFEMGKAFPAHAGWIKVLAENGIIGIVILILFVASFGYTGFVSPGKGMRLFGMLISLALAVSLLSTEFQSKGLWLLTAGAMVILRFGFPGENSPALPKGRSSTRRTEVVQRRFNPRWRPSFSKTHGKALTQTRS